MMVTQAAPEQTAQVRTAQQLSQDQIASIRLAVAQWMRSARAVAEAQDELRALHVPPDELFRRRRAESADPNLAVLLRLAVTLVITRGVLEPSDRRRFAPLLDNDIVQAVVKQVAHARRHVSQLEQSLFVGVPSVDLDVGDY